MNTTIPLSDATISIDLTRPTPDVLGFWKDFANVCAEFCEVREDCKVGLPTTLAAFWHGAACADRLRHKAVETTRRSGSADTPGRFPLPSYQDYLGLLDMLRRPATMEEDRYHRNGFAYWLDKVKDSPFGEGGLYLDRYYDFA